MYRDKDIHIYIYIIMCTFSVSAMLYSSLHVYTVYFYTYSSSATKCRPYYTSISWYAIYD